MIQNENAASVSRDDWNTHWDVYAESARFNPAQRYRRKLIFSSLKRDSQLSSEQLLDIGSGQGDFALDIQVHFPGTKILGLELSQSGVHQSQQKVPQGTFLQQDLLNFQAPPQKFEKWAHLAVCSEVLEHVEDPGKILSNIRPYLAPNAKLIVTVPGGPMSAFDRHIGHRKHYRLGELKGLLENNGYRIESISGAGFPFFNLYKMVVIARGKNLINEVALTGTQHKLSFLARVVMRIFTFLFIFNLKRSRFGWQMICIARKVEDGAHSYET